MRRILIALWMILASSPVFAQETLYPVPPANTGFGGMRIEGNPRQEDRRAFIAEKPLEYKLTLGFPTDDQATFLRDTKADVIVLWLRVENLSRRPMTLNTEQFAATDKDGRAYSRIAPAAAFDRIVAGAPITKKILSKGIRSATLGKIAGKSELDEDKDEAVRFGLPTTVIPALGLKQGLIYLEAPKAKEFTMNISLGDLWSKPFVFTNVKSKK